MATVLYHYGARHDTEDDRDFRVIYPQLQICCNPIVDLRKYVNHIYDQGNLNSCTANALCAAYAIDLMKQSLTLSGGYYYFNPSRLFLYYNTREHEGTTQHDAGASIRDTIRALNRRGVCQESEWPYVTKDYTKKPTAKAYRAAECNDLYKYECLNQDLDQLRACLTDNCTFIFGFNVYQSFHSYDNQTHGAMSMPTYAERAHEPVGRLAVVAVGYDDDKNRFIILNSWGEGWGDRGYFYMPYECITDSSLCFDFWKITFTCGRSRLGMSDSTDGGMVVGLPGAVLGHPSSYTPGYYKNEYGGYSSSDNEEQAPEYQYNDSCCCMIQ